LLHGAFVDGAPQRVARRRRAQPGDWVRRAGLGGGDAPAPRVDAAAQRRRGYGLRHRGFVPQVRDLGFTPHLAQNTIIRRSAIDGRTTRQAWHAASQRIRKRIEEPFGWIKTVAGGRKLRYIGQARNLAWFKITAAVYTLVRITALDATPA
jgi:YD repeat-containing protein